MWWVACEPRGSGAVVTCRAVFIYREPCLSSAFSFVSVNCLALTLSFVLKSLSVMVGNRSREGLQRTPPWGCILAVYGEERVCSRTKPHIRRRLRHAPFCQVRVGFDLYHLKSFQSRIVIDDSLQSFDLFGLGGESTELVAAPLPGQPRRTPPLANAGGRLLL